MSYIAMILIVGMGLFGYVIMNTQKALETKIGEETNEIY